MMFGNRGNARRHRGVYADFHPGSFGYRSGLHQRTQAADLARTHGNHVRMAAAHGAIGLVQREHRLVRPDGDGTLPRNLPQRFE